MATPGEELLPIIIEGVMPLTSDEIELGVQRASIAERVILPANEMLRYYATIQNLQTSNKEAIHLLACAVNGPWSDGHLVAARALIQRVKFAQERTPALPTALSRVKER